MGEALSYCLQPLVTLLQLLDAVLPLSYSIMKEKQLPQLLQAEISWGSLNNLVIQAKPVPLGFSTCSTQSISNGLTASAGKSCLEGSILTGSEDTNLNLNPGSPMKAARKELPDGTVGNAYKLQIFLLITQTRPPIRCTGGFTADVSGFQSTVTHPKPSSLAVTFYSF